MTRAEIKEQVLWRFNENMRCDLDLTFLSKQWLMRMVEWAVDYTSIMTENQLKETNKWHK